MAKISFNIAKYGLDKLIGGRAQPKKASLDEKALRRAGVGILIHDERWNRLFSTVKKPPAIVKAEESITSLVDEKTRLNMENNINQAEKQVNLRRISELTEHALNARDTASFIEHDERGTRVMEIEERIREGDARAGEIDERIKELDARINEIDERESQIAQRIEAIDSDVKSENLALLETGISYLYQYMKKSQAKVSELDERITETRESLKAYISERETLEESVNETYNFLHGLLGVEQIDSLDEHYTL